MYGYVSDDRLMYKSEFSFGMVVLRNSSFPSPIPKGMEKINSATLCGKNSFPFVLKCIFYS